MMSSTKLAMAAWLTLLAVLLGDVAQAETARREPSSVESGGSDTSGESSWGTFRDDDRGFAIRYPADWFVAPDNLTPYLGGSGPRWEIVSLGTNPDFEPADHNCAQVPVNALEQLRPADAFISVQERLPPSGDASLPRRPGRFESTTGIDGASTDLSACLSVVPPASLRWIPFAAKGREFYIVVAIGNDAPPSRRADTYRILDTMTISPARLPCDAVIGGQKTLRGGQRAIGRSVALTTGRALQANRSGEDDPTARLFAKNGLLVRPGSTFELVVPRRWRDRLTISWGKSPRTSHLLVSGCGTPGGADWLAYAGGYYVDDPACVPLLVRANRASRRV
jgi:hypothetical protein